MLAHVGTGAWMWPRWRKPRGFDSLHAPHLLSADDRVLKVGVCKTRVRGLDSLSAVHFFFKRLLTVTALSPNLENMIKWFPITAKNFRPMGGGLVV